MPTTESSTFHSDQLVSSLQLLGQIGELLEINPAELNDTDIFLTKLRHLQNLHHTTQNRLDTYDLVLPTVQQHFLEMTSLAKVLNEKQNSITNRQNEKFDRFESMRLTTMAEMKFIENQLQSFDIHAKPAVTHTNVAKLEQEVENLRCEQEILQQQTNYWMPSDEPTIDSLTIKVEQVRDQLRNVEEEISSYVTDAFQLNKHKLIE